MKMNHTEKVLGGVLGSLLASNPAEESNDENDEETCKDTTNEAHDESPTESFIEDVCEFFNISKSNSNESNKDNSSTQDLNEQLKEQTSATTLKSAHSWSIAEEIEKIRRDFPINDESCDNLPELSDAPSTSSKAHIVQKGSATDISQSPGNNDFLKEVKRVLYEVKSSDFPEKNTQKYFDVAQEYAIYGDGFLDFPKDLNAICKEARANKEPIFQPPEFRSSSSEDEVVQHRDYPYYATKRNVGENAKNIEHSIHKHQSSPARSSNNIRPFLNERQTTNNSQLSHAAATSAATAATYYQLCSNLQPSLRPVAVINSSTSAGASNAASRPGYVLLSNRVTYLAHGTHNMTPQQIFFNQQQLSTTTNFFGNQASINSPSNVRFQNPVVATTTTTQHISNTVYKETQYVANVPMSNASGSSSVNAYERLVNAQLVRQVLQTRQQQQHQQQQQQQQALIAAAIYQQQLHRQQHQIRMVNSLQNTVMNAVSSAVNSNANVNVDRNIASAVGQAGSVETTCTMLQVQSVDVARVNFNSEPGLINFPENNNNSFNSPHQG